MKYLPFLCCLGLACAPAVDVERESTELLRIHAAEMQAHVDLDLDALMQHVGEWTVEVVDGAINALHRSNMRNRLERQLEGVRYVQYSDVEPPIIRVSRDGTMGWVITRVAVTRVEPNPAGGQQERGFVYAGLATYEKQEGTWVKVATIGTFEPDSFGN